MADFIKNVFSQKDSNYNDENGFLKNTLIGLPRTPGVWVSLPEYRPITRINMSCGGGMGGSHWYEYVERIDISKLENHGTSQLIKVKTIDGNDKLINLNYVVEIDSEVTLVSATMRSENHNFPVGTYEYRFLVRDGRKVKLVDHH